MKGYWVKGGRYPDGKEVIHHVDTLEEALFLKSQLMCAKILDWGDGQYLTEKERMSTV